MVGCSLEVRARWGDDLRLCALEQLVGRNALEPSLVRELFVVGEVQANNQTDAGEAILLFPGIGRKLAPVKLELKFLVEAETLAPPVYAQACLLRRIFVITKIKNQKCRHSISIGGRDQKCQVEQDDVSRDISGPPLSNDTDTRN
jgi:hypothetical protein